MPTGGWGVAWTVGSFLLGMAVTFGTTFLNHRHTLKRERIARSVTRSSALRDQRVAFEATHLLDLHNAVSELFDNWILIAHLRGERQTLRGGDLHSRRESESNAELDVQLTQELGEAGPAAEKAEATVRRLAGLVLNDEVRGYVRDAVSNIDAFHSRYETLSLAEMLEQADGVARELQAVREVIAAHLRHVYTGILPRGI
ncbi:hypothetical protein [Streptomyces sp. NRRL F-5755]|uniref:hypothetical protein n=1 Tax=Streptomyces sp. NRRL F-5755 TaxID=1519475 RepID=UPI001331BF02|nr:hypothetical protein [Streptomyces sp. NRRL F-5755]